MRKEIEKLLNDFGFVDPNRVVEQLKSIFNIGDEDINVLEVLHLPSYYEVHYKDVVVTIKIVRYEFKIVKIEEYCDTI